MSLPFFVIVFLFLNFYFIYFYGSKESFWQKLPQRVTSTTLWHMPLHPGQNIKRNGVGRLSPWGRTVCIKSGFSTAKIYRFSSCKAQLEVVRSDPLSKLPFEFKLHVITLPNGSFGPRERSTHAGRVPLLCPHLRPWPAAFAFLSACPFKAMHPKWFWTVNLFC